MCGIVGVYGNLTLDDESSLSTFVHASLEKLQHRGPDSYGNLRFENNMEFGHTRLSILDTSVKGFQPRETTKSILVYNGEIYNYKELRRFLEEKGIQPQSESDTEVLHALLDLEGLQCLERLNGMFAFAYYLKTNNEMYLVRDRFGVKPLYYISSGNTKYFASEMRILFSLCKSWNFNLNSLNAYITDTATDFDSNTPILGIQQVPAGSYLYCSPGGSKLVNWYKFEKHLSLKKKFSKDTYEELLLDSIKLRLRSDVPVCLTLSGGVDSSTIYTLIKERIGTPIELFTYDLPGSRNSELERVQYLANYYGDNLNVVVDSNESDFKFDSLIDDILVTEYPIWSFSTSAYREIYKSISSRGFKVVLEGHGADEFLGGYGYFYRNMASTSLRRFNFHHFIRYLAALQKTERASDGIDLKQLTIEAKTNLQMTLTKNLLDFDSARIEAVKYKILPMVLRAFDRLSMAYSLESRAPFMDYRLAELSLTMPASELIGFNSNKVVTRSILRKYGHSCISENRQKLGFAADIEKIENGNDFRDKAILAVSNSHLLTKHFQRQQASALSYYGSRRYKEDLSFEATKILLVALFEQSVIRDSS